MSNRLQQLLDIATANSEDDFADFSDITKPENYNREEMSVMLEDTLGCDYTSYYDKQQLRNIAESIRGDFETPEVVKDYLSNPDDAVEKAYGIFEQMRDESVLPAAMESAIEEVTGVEIDIDVDEDDDFDDEDDFDSEEDYGEDEED